MIQLKTFKYRLEPNKQQKVLINKTLGCCRFLYNQMLNEKQVKYLIKDKSKCKTEKQYKAEFGWLKEVDSVALQQTRIDLQTAYTNFFRKIKQKNNKTSLKFKSKKNPKHSYRTVNISDSIRIQDSKIKLPKLGFVNFVKSREVAGKIKSVTVTKNILNKYYISILCETEIGHKSKLTKEIGIDLGVKDFCICSDNIKVSNPKYLRQSELKLAKEQRRLCRKVKGSNRRFKQQKRVFRAHQKIANQRNDFLHKLSTRLINENQVICLEDLSVKNMVKNHCLAKSVSDASWSKFVDMLKYKSNWYGRELVQIGRFFPSSKMCSVCKTIKEDLTIEDRVWTCESCKTTHDRDLNASFNILREGLKVKENRWNSEVSSLNIQTIVCSS